MLIWEAIKYAKEKGIKEFYMDVVPIASRVSGVPEIVEGTFAEEMLFCREILESSLIA